MGKSLGKKVLDRENLKMKISLLASRFSLLAFTFFVMLFSSLVNSQVIIKEKVEINPLRQFIGDNPSFSFPDTLNGGSGNKLISSNPQYQPDNFQSTFPLSEGGRVTVEVVYSEAAENSQINLELRQPNQETLLEYANQNAGFTWVSPDYFANTNFEIGIYWYWENEGTLYQGVEAGAEVSSLGFDEYYVGFEAAGDDWDYNELVVRIKIETYLPLVLIDPPNISTGETAVVTVKKQFYDGRIEDFDAGQLFEFGMMEGCAAGVLISGTDTSNYFNGVTQPVTFLAADSLENDEETVKIGVGVVEQNPLAKMQTKTNTLTQVKNKNTKVKDKNDDTKIDETKINSIIIGSCFGGDFASYKIGDANLVVGNECKNDRPLGLTFIDENVYHIQKIADNSNCDAEIEENHTQGGSTELIIHRPLLSGWGKSPHKSVLEFNFEFNWSYCIDLLNEHFSNAKFIEYYPENNTFYIIDLDNNTVDEVNSIMTAKEIIESCKSVTNEGQISPKIKYYPLTRTKLHEMEHIDQYREKVFIEYFTMLYHINRREPTNRNWCNVSEAEKSLIYNLEEEYYESILIQTQDKVIKYLNDPKIKETHEKDAHAAAYGYIINTFIPKLKEKFDLN